MERDFIFSKSSSVLIGQRLEDAAGTLGIIMKVIHDFVAPYCRLLTIPRLITAYWSGNVHSSIYIEIGIYPTQSIEI